VVIINETMARRFWPGENPLGKRLRTSGSEKKWYEVVGVCRDYKVRTVGEETRPYVHWVFDQRDNPFQMLLARTAGDPAPMLESLRRELRSIEPDLVFMDVRTMPENMAVTLYPVRVGATLLSVFGFLALGMAAVGLYGVIAYSVSRRTHEFGLRMALGARTADVLRLVVKQGMVLVTVGIVLGMVGATAVTWVLTSVLYGVTALDPVTFGATSLFLAAVALLANWIPAHRAAHIDPMDALRYE
jgi:predicted permease